MSPTDGLRAARALWDEAAASFDNEADHGLRDPAVRAAWRDLLARLLPPAPAAVLDIGCGTGSLSALLAELGHRVTAGDLSPAMLAQARTKTAGQAVTLHLMDAAAPSLAPGRFDVVLCRHLLWALPGTAEVLRRWAALLRPGGRLVLIEGRWSTGAGLTISQIITAQPAELWLQDGLDLRRQRQLWGQRVSDERYALVLGKRPAG